MNQIKIEFKSYKERIKIGKQITLKKKKDFDQELQIIKKEIDQYKIKVKDKIFCIFELELSEENIDCFIGYTLEEKPKETGTLEIMLNSKEKQLVGTGPIHEMNTIYQKMIKYADENNIQIRGFFTIRIKQNEIEMYVEAFDLKEENKDQIYYLEHFQEEKTLDPSLVGTYEIREILPDLKYMFNPEKQKSKLNTKYKKLILKEDGTTNYENIRWNQKQLIITYHEINIPLPIYKRIYKNTIYLEILMNENYEYYKSQRPMEYLYIKTEK